jgi:hypothetical protein
MVCVGPRNSRFSLSSDVISVARTAEIERDRCFRSQRATLLKYFEESRLDQGTKANYHSEGGRSRKFSLRSDCGELMISTSKIFGDQQALEIDV